MLDDILDYIEGIREQPVCAIVPSERPTVADSYAPGCARCCAGRSGSRLSVV